MSLIAASTTVPFKTESARRFENARYEKSAGAVLDRLAHIVDAKNDTEAAERFGVQRSTWSSWRTRNSVPYEFCVEVAMRMAYSLDWLLMGAEPMQRFVASDGTPTAPTSAVLQNPDAAPPDALFTHFKATAELIGDAAIWAENWEDFGFALENAFQHPLFDHNPVDFAMALGQVLTAGVERALG